ncbi:uncharacterized protein LOC124157310 [Ischnura elegans]|uniref:uncharacterized protein LOC124157310 n=1 Tax=Ischnura elegans TaxID=197161 RepID=UPI001ED8B096|nr:uncharacterized protein LOC124157310 [Ischnura elegans]
MWQVLGSGSAVLCLDRGPRLNLPFLEISPLPSNRDYAHDDNLLLQHPLLLRAFWCGRLQDVNKPASSPSMGTGVAPVVVGGPAATSPWSAANRGAADAGGGGGLEARRGPTLQVASMSSSFSSSTSSNSSASSTSTSNPPATGHKGYFRPVYNGPRHLGVIEDVVSERGFSILPEKMIPVNAITTSPALTANLQSSRRIRSPSPPSGRRSRRGMASMQRQSSTDSRPSSPTSNDSSIPPHRSSSAAPLPIHSQTATLAPGRWSAGGGRWTEQYVGDTSTTNHDCCTSGTLSGQERVFTSDESSTPYRSDSSSGRRPQVGAVMDIEELPRGRRPMVAKGDASAVAVALVLALEEPPQAEGDDGSPRFIEITEESEEKAAGTSGGKEATAEKGADVNDVAANPVEKGEGGDAADDVDGAAGAALGTALAIVAAEGSEGATAEDASTDTKPAPAGGEEEIGLAAHPNVPEGSEGPEAGAKVEKAEEEGMAEEKDKGKKGEKEANNEMLKEEEEEEGDGGVGGAVVEGDGKKEVEVVEVEGRVEGAGSGEGSKGAAVVQEERQEKEQEAPPKADQGEADVRPRRESNCGGAALPIDLSLGLLDIDEESLREKGLSFTTLPLEIPNSPPPRPKHLSCSYPSGALQLAPDELQEDPMSATFVVPPLNHKGGDATTPGSTIPSAPYGSKYAGQTRNGKISQGAPRESRRSLPNRPSKASVSSAPAVHPSRSSSTSTALFPESLPPVKNPKDALRQSFQNMDDPDWEVAMKGLELLVRLIRHHPSYVQGELTRVIATLARQIRNLRSQVARAACQASGELALPRVAPASPTSLASDSSVASTSLLRRALEADLEEVAAPLLHRSADTNRFLRDDCVAALDRFVAGVGPSRVVGPILSKGVTHQNALVRTVTARLLATIVAKLGAERVMTQLNKDVRAKVLRAGANLLMEGSLQTRTYAKQVFRCLAAHESFERALTQSVPPTVLRNIHKTLLSIKKESLAAAGADPSWEA